MPVEMKVKVKHKVSGKTRASDDDATDPIVAADDTLAVQVSSTIAHVTLNNDILQKFTETMACMKQEFPEWENDTPATKGRMAAYDPELFASYIKSAAYTHENDAGYTSLGCLHWLDGLTPANPHVSINAKAVDRLCLDLSKRPLSLDYDFVVAIPTHAYDTMQFKGALVLLSPMEELHACCKHLAESDASVEAKRAATNNMNITFKFVPQAHWRAETFSMREDKFNVARATVYSTRQRVQFVIGERNVLQGMQAKKVKVPHWKLVSHLKAVRVADGFDALSENTVRMAVNIHDQLLSDEGASNAFMELETSDFENPLDRISSCYAVVKKGTTSEGIKWYLELLLHFIQCGKVGTKLSENDLEGKLGSMMMMKLDLQHDLDHKLKRLDFPDDVKTSLSQKTGAAKTMSKHMANLQKLAIQFNKWSAPALAYLDMVNSIVYSDDFDPTISTGAFKENIRGHS